MNDTETQAIVKLVAQVNELRAELGTVKLDWYTEVERANAAEARVAKVEAERDMKVAAMSTLVEHAAVRAEGADALVVEVEAERDSIILEAGKVMEDDRETIATLKASAERSEMEAHSWKAEADDHLAKSNSAHIRANVADLHVAQLIEASHDAIEWLLELGADKTHEDARHVERLAAAQLPPKGPA